ncbi:MAG TPA: prenyltransferase/squalene oxidase repeat-containing protein [Conexibacter sp.]|nr:prenyltransferase/squalene oxidase repeat-containing protein [Conexibacter sp.]
MARSARLLLCAAGVALIALALVLPAGAAAPDRRNEARLDLTIRFLQDVQNRDGGFGGRRGNPSDPLFTAWVAIALAAGGVNPQDQRKPGGVDAYSYAARHAGELRYTTDFERAALVAVAAGASPRSFGRVDLVRRILARQLPDGGFAYDEGGQTGYVNATAFAILPLSTLGEPRLADALRRGADWLLSVQEPTGAWGYAPGAEPSTDITASVIQALHAIGRTGTPQEAEAWDHIRALHNPRDGGFGFNEAHPESNTASTSWVVQAMWAAGIDPDRFAPGGPSPLDYLASLQRDDGSIAWKRGDDLNSVWMTAYAAPAYGGHPLPVPSVPRAEEVARRPRQASARTTGALEDAPVAGEGGFEGERGGTVIAGGGSEGAQLFSRLQPQSQGRTPGGVRDTTDAAARRAAGGRAAGGRAAAGAQGDGGTGERDAAPAAAGGGREVTGVVLGGGRAPAAPGLRGAQAGGRTPGPALALGLTGALLLCAGLGAGWERRRPDAGALA